MSKARPRTPGDATMNPENRPLSANHPVFSDYCYMSNPSGALDIGNISFAVGLRESPEVSESMIDRILPMTKIIPGEVKERTIRSTKKKGKQEEEIICEREDCRARRNRYEEIASENDGLKNQLKLLASRVASSKNKINLTEKSIRMAEEQNEQLQGKIEEAEARVFTVEVEVERGDKQNEQLRVELESLRQQIEELKMKTHKEENSLRLVVEANSGKGVVFASGPSRYPKLAREVSVLKFNDDDSDDDR